MKTKNLLFALLFFCAYYKSFGQIATIEKLAVSEKDYKYETFQVKSITNSKLSKKQLQDLNNRIKIAFFSENVVIEDRNIPTLSLTIPQILKSYTDAVKESAKEGNIHYGTTDISYQINCNKFNILSIIIKNEFMGAHPNINIDNYSFDLKTGEIISKNDLFISTQKHQEFKKLMEKKIKERVAKKVKEIEKGEAEELSNKPLRVENLDFNISEKGITFIHNFDLPYIMKALEPDTDYTFSWAELSGFIKKDGIFAPFYKK